MAMHLDDVRAVTLDFYGTLVHPRDGRGRGERVVEFLEEHDLPSDPWEHQVLYDVFEPHDREYSPELSPPERQRYRRRLAQRLFRRLGVADPEERAREHAERIWELLGPPCLAVFDEVPEVLATLRRRGFPLAIVSNWQHGLRHFCAELDLLEFFDHVVVSAEVGSAKPDPGIFHEACRRLGRAPAAVLHVGDRPVDDVKGARAAGLRVLLLDRGGEAHPDVATIRSLAELPDLLSRDLDDGHG